MSAGLTAHAHDILEAVKTRAPRVVDWFAVVCSEGLINVLHVQPKLCLTKSM